MATEQRKKKEFLYCLKLAELFALNSFELLPFFFNQTLKICLFDNYLSFSFFFFSFPSLCFVCLEQLKFFLTVIHTFFLNFVTFSRLFFLPFLVFRVNRQKKNYISFNYNLLISVKSLLHFGEHYSMECYFFFCQVYH